MHELTERVWGKKMDGKKDYYPFINEADSIIREYLGEKAMNIARHVMPSKYKHEREAQAMSVLGLSESSSPEKAEQGFGAFIGSLVDEITGSDCKTEYKPTEQKVEHKVWCKWFMNRQCDCQPKPTESKKQEWCEHLTISDKWAVIQSADEIYEGIKLEIKVCPICGTPRPQKPKTTREILEKYCTPNPGFGDAFGYCVQEIEQHFVEHFKELEK